MTSFDEQLILPTRMHLQGQKQRPLEVAEAEWDFVELAQGLDALKYSLDTAALGSQVFFSATFPALTAKNRIGDIWIDTQKGDIYRLEAQGSGATGVILGWQWYLSLWNVSFLTGDYDPDLSTCDTNGNIIAGYTFFNTTTKVLWKAESSVYSGSVDSSNPWIQVLDFGLLPDMSNKSGCALFTDGSTALWRKIRPSDIQADFAITGFSCTSSMLELGQTLTNPTFTASYNEVITLARVKDSDNATWTTLALPATSFSRVGVFKKTSISSVSFTLEATASALTSKSTSVSWAPKRFWGVGVLGSQDGATFISKLSSDLGTNSAKTINYVGGVTDHLYYAVPSTFSTPVFSVGGFVGGFRLVGTYSLTNTFGVTLSYQLWESDKTNLGSTTVVIS